MGIISVGGKVLTIGGGVASRAAVGGGGGGGDRTLLTADDLAWQGYWKLPTSAESGKQAYSTTPGAGGHTAYMCGSLAVRYVGGQRRLLIPMFCNQDGTTAQQFEDLVEWGAPADPTLYTGSTATNAQPMREQRRWADWTCIDDNSSVWHSNPIRPGGMWWDETNGLLWYSFTAYYRTDQYPSLACTQLLDTSLGGGYYQVGTKYGPWYYRTSSSTPYWKQACHILHELPAAAQAAIGTTHILGGWTTAVGGEGYLGVGFAGFDLPSPSLAANSVIAEGTRLANYSSVDSPLTLAHCRRDTNYAARVFNEGITGLYRPTGGTGYWQMTLDQVNSLAWVDNGSKHGVVSFGRQVTGSTWYNGNPFSNSEYWVPPDGWDHLGDATDETLVVDTGNHYSGDVFSRVVRIFDPSVVYEVADGTRVPWADTYGGKSGIGPATHAWPSAWSNMPLPIPQEGGSVARSISSNLGGNTAYWDPIAEELIWVYAETVDSSRPTIHFFTVT